MPAQPQHPGLTSPAPRDDRGWLWLGVVGLGALAIHGALLLNDGIYWDGWLVYWLRHDGNWSEFAHWGREAGGLPVPLVLRWILGSLPATDMGFKLAAFASILGAAYLVYLLATHIRGWNKAESMMLALLALAYPAYQTAVEMNSTKYLVTYAFFLWGAYLGCRSEAFAGRRHVIWRIASGTCFALSFGTSSLLVFYLGYLVIWLEYATRIRKLSRAGLLRFMMRRADVLLIPAVYQMVVRYFFPSRGNYQGYNAITVSQELLRDGYQTFYERAISGQWSEALARLGEQRWVAAGAVLVLAVAWCWSTRARFMPAPARSHFAAIGFALGLLLLGMLPYVVVGKPAWRHGWSSRHALLVGLPMALVLVTIVRALCAGRAQVWQRAGFVVLGTCLWLFTVSTWSYYLSWQARWAKDLSIITQLRDAGPEVRSRSTFWIIDQFPVSPETHYEFYEWAGMFRRAWGDESHIGLDVRTPGAPTFPQDGQPYFRSRYQLSTYDPAGRQATLTITPGAVARTEAGLALAYWRARFLQPDSLPDFLRGVATVSVRESPAKTP